MLVYFLLWVYEYYRRIIKVLGQITVYFIFKNYSVFYIKKICLTQVLLKDMELRLPVNIRQLLLYSVWITYRIKNKKSLNSEAFACLTSSHSYYPAKFSGQKSCDSGNINFSNLRDFTLVAWSKDHAALTSRKHMFKELSEFMSRSFSRLVTTLPYLMAIG